MRQFHLELCNNYCRHKTETALHYSHIPHSLLLRMRIPVRVVQSLHAIGTYFPDETRIKNQSDSELLNYTVLRYRFYCSFILMQEHLCGPGSISSLVNFLVEVLFQSFSSPVKQMSRNLCQIHLRVSYDHNLLLKPHSFVYGHRLSLIIIISVFCPRAGPSLQPQEPRLQFCRKQVFHRKLRNQGYSSTRDE